MQQTHINDGFDLDSDNEGHDPADEVVIGSLEFHEIKAALEEGNAQVERGEFATDEEMKPEVREARCLARLQSEDVYV